MRESFFSDLIEIIVIPLGIVTLILSASFSLSAIFLGLAWKVVVWSGLVV